MINMKHGNQRRRLAKTGRDHMECLHFTQQRTNATLEIFRRRSKRSKFVFARSICGDGVKSTICPNILATIARITWVVLIPRIAVGATEEMPLSSLGGANDFVRTVPQE
jgi:hypothetical protein